MNAGRPSRWRLGAVRAASLGAMSVACAGEPPGQRCAGETSQALVNAAASEHYLQLDATHTQAIVTIVSSEPEQSGMCTGTLLGGKWVLTARHCLKLASPSVLLDSTLTPRPREVLRVFPHAELDLALLELSSPAQLGIAPNAVISWLKPGDPVVLAGYGLTEHGAAGALRFLIESVALIERDSIVVSGEGLHGACEGDSGGPLLVRGPDGTVQVAGVLSAGAPSCLGRDRYVRTDVAREWIDQVTGGIGSPGNECGGIDAQGRCLYRSAMWCSGSRLMAEPCGNGERCGWNAAQGGFRCVAERSDACDGVDALGACRENQAVWCEAGQLRRADCGSCGACRRDGRSGAASCGAAPGQLGNGT